MDDSPSAPAPALRHLSRKRKADDADIPQDDSPLVARDSAPIGSDLSVSVSATAGEPREPLPMTTAGPALADVSNATPRPLKRLRSGSPSGSAKHHPDGPQPSPTSLTPSSSSPQSRGYNMLPASPSTLFPGRFARYSQAQLNYSDMGVIEKSIQSHPADFATIKPPTIRPPKQRLSSSCPSSPTHHHPRRPKPSSGGARPAGAVPRPHQAPLAGPSGAASPAHGPALSPISPSHASCPSSPHHPVHQHWTVLPRSHLPNQVFIPPIIPPVNKATLADLDLGKILRDPQTRHDFLFDPALQFRPVSSRRKRLLCDQYWAAITREIETHCTCTTFNASGKMIDSECVCRECESGSEAMEIDDSSSSSSSSSQSPSPPPQPHPVTLSHPSGDPTVARHLTVRVPSRIPPLLGELHDLLLSVILPQPAHVPGPLPQNPAVWATIAHLPFVNTPEMMLLQHQKKQQAETEQKKPQAPMMQRTVSGPPQTQCCTPLPKVTPHPTHLAQAAALRGALDPELIAQELRHGVFDPRGLFALIGDILKNHCAPMRDALIDTMVAIGSGDVEVDAAGSVVRPGEAGASGSGNGVGSGSNVVLKQRVRALRLCFEILELCKLDVVNHQLQALRPFLTQTAPDFERAMFQQRRITHATTRAWLQAAYTKLVSSTLGPSTAITPVPCRPPVVKLAFVNALVELVFSPPPPPVLPPTPTGTAAPRPVPPFPGFPETLYLDHTRLLTVATDIASLVAMYMLLMLYRQLRTMNTSSSNTPHVPVAEYELTRLKKEVRDVGPKFLGMCFLADPPSTGEEPSATSSEDAVTSPSVYAASRNSIAGRIIGNLVPTAPGQRQSKSWEKYTQGMSNALLHVAHCATNQPLSSSASPLSSEPHSLPGGVAPSADTINLVERWAHTNLRVGSPLSKLLKQRVHEALISVLLTHVPDLPPRDTPTPLASPATASTPMSTHQNANPIVASGLEPLMPEIRQLGERINKIVALHYPVYSGLYESIGFVMP